MNEELVYRTKIIHCLLHSALVCVPFYSVVRLVISVILTRCINGK